MQDGRGHTFYYGQAKEARTYGRVPRVELLLVVFALFVAWRRGRLMKTVKYTGQLCGNPRETKRTIEADTQHNRFPYGPAIAVGCVLAVLI